MKFVAVSVRKSEHFLVARPEFKELKDLKGKRLAVSTLFGTDQRAAEEILRAKGFPIDFIKPLALGDAPIRTQALRTGIVEAAAVSSPFDLTLKADGYRVLGGPQDIEFALPTSGIAVANRLLQQNPQLVKRMVRATDESAPLCFREQERGRAADDPIFAADAGCCRAFLRSVGNVVEQKRRNHRSGVGHFDGEKEASGRSQRLFFAQGSAEGIETKVAFSKAGQTLC